MWKLLQQLWWAWPSFSSVSSHTHILHRIFHCENCTHHHAWKLHWQLLNSHPERLYFFENLIIFIMGKYWIQKLVRLCNQKLSILALISRMMYISTSQWELSWHSLFGIIFLALLQVFLEGCWMTELKCMGFWLHNGPYFSKALLVHNYLFLSTKLYF